MARDVLQTPYKDAVVPTPGGSPAGSGDTVGGFDLGPGSAKESPNSVSGLPAAVTTVGVEGGPSTPGTQVPMPPVNSPGTFPARGSKE